MGLYFSLFVLIEADYQFLGNVMKKNLLLKEEKKR